MRTFINRLKQHRLTQAIVLCTLLLVVSYALNQFKEKTEDLKEVAQTLEEGIDRTQDQIDQLFQNPAFLLQAITGQIPKDSLSRYQQREYTLLILDQQDSILYWSNNKALPLKIDLSFKKEDKTEKYEIGESIYLKSTKQFSFNLNDTTKYYNFVALLPIYKHYSITNDYLFDHFPLLERDESENIRLSKQKDDFEVMISDTEKIFITGTYGEKWNILNGLIFLMSLLGCLIFILLICKACFEIMSRFSFAVGATLMGISFFVFRMAAVFYELPLQQQSTYIYNTKISNANTLWVYTLGDLIFDTLALCLVTLFFNRTLHHNRSNIIQYVRSRSWNIFICYLMMILGLFGIFFGVEDIVRSSFISFDFNNFSYLNWTTLYTLSAVCLIVLCYFSLSVKLYRIALPDPSYTSQSHWLIYIFILFVCSAGSAWFFQTSINELVYTTFFALLNHYLLSRYQHEKHISLGWMGIFLIFYSALLTTSIEDAAEQKSMDLRKSYAKQIAIERDAEAEFHLHTMAEAIQDDELLRVLFSNPFYPSPRKQAIELLKYRYLDNQFLGRYHYSVHLYTDRNKPFRDEPLLFDQLNTPFINGKTLNEYLTFSSFTTGDFSYRLVIPIQKKKRRIGQVIMVLHPIESIDHSNIYVELLSRKKSVQKEIFKDFTFALYKKGQRVKTNGIDFNIQLPYNFPIPDSNTYIRINDQRMVHQDCIVYHDANGNICLITVPNRDFFSVLSVFAYIFCFGILLLILYQLSFLFMKKMLGVSFNTFIFEQSLREKIQRGILIVTLSSFVAIAMITIIYYSFEYTDYHRSRLDRKVESTAKTANWQIKNNESSSKYLPNATSLADIHKIDVNIFDVSGNLVSSSERIVFDRHLLSRKIDPVAYYTIKKEKQNKLIQNELINHFEYLSAYVPLKNKKEEIIGFLNLPYDMAGNSNIGSQNVVRFLGALLNVYVVFLIIAALAAFFIANSVSNPLHVIGEKLDNLRLGVKNEMIEWKNDDEIGELVQRYNSMIMELERNAIELARTQKETAWREMAKQVAHEIKNPLTPMKLNIQLLQRAVQNNPEKASNMVEKVSKALIEQIDALSTIASEFSNFAKMPVAKNEQVNLNQLVQNVTELFSGEEVEINLTTCQSDCIVFADKDQIIRVLNNLLKNAIQAIPDDQKGLISIQLTHADNMAKIMVKDNGIGIPENQYNEIFIPNFTTKSSGTGIGLAMSKNIVEMAKGKIYFESKEGIGTTFFVELPTIKEE